MGGNKEVPFSQAEADAILGDSAITESEPETINIPRRRGKDWKEDRKWRVKEIEAQQLGEHNITVIFGTSSPREVARSAYYVRRLITRMFRKKFQLTIISGDKLVKQVLRRRKT